MGPLTMMATVLLAVAQSARDTRAATPTWADLLPLHHAAQLFDQPSDAAVVGDHLRHAAAEQGQEEDLVHAGETVPDALGKEGDIQIAKGQADDAGGEDADGQHQEHIHADQRQYQHGGGRE